MIYNIKKVNFVKYPHYIDILNGKVRVAYAKCPKCNNFISLYKHETDDFGLTKKAKECSCKFVGRLQLEGWNE